MLGTPSIRSGEPKELLLTDPQTSRTRPRWLRLAVALAAGLVVAVALFMAATSGQQSREQAFLESVRSDPTVTGMGDLPDEQLLVSLDGQCEKIADGWTEQDEASAARTNYAGVPDDTDVTEAQFVANAVALYRAAEKVCG
ncbi:hypothetical protein [Agromyces humi]|uniref:hypothetical protein n=1 Tax=Agromyces humi TaxID=1766800 RepID=UPI00135A1918|nr:hypothetical protein [Agromyces humi]